MVSILFLVVGGLVVRIYVSEPRHGKRLAQ